MNDKRGILFISLGLTLLLLVVNVFVGSVRIPFSEIMNIFIGKGSNNAIDIIIRQSRIPQAITALLAGAALAASGLLLQTLFRNPLAGPSILGISDGANLGVAIVTLAFGGAIGASSNILLSGYVMVVLAAFIGASGVLALIIYFSTKVKNNVMLLIIGIMVGYIASSCISLLNFYATQDKVHAYVTWGFGNFSGISMNQLPYFCGFTLFGLAGAVILIKPLNVLLLGEQYAENLGIVVKRTRIMILICTGIMTATVTAFCGPISFIGLAVPHVARLMLGSSNHSNLLPLTILVGSSIALLCNLITVMPFFAGMLPLNAVTPILGAPVIIYVIVNRKNIQYFD